jgi:hypothetical protein
VQRKINVKPNTTNNYWLDRSRFEISKIPELFSFSHPAYLIQLSNENHMKTLQASFLFELLKLDT